MRLTRSRSLRPALQQKRNAHSTLLLLNMLRTKTNHPCAAANLPTEIWLQILVVAGIKSTAVMRLVCETLNRIGSDEWLWKQLAIELQNKKKRIPPRTDIGQVSFPSGVTPSWFEFCKLLAKGKILSCLHRNKILACIGQVG